MNERILIVGIDGVLVRTRVAILAGRYDPISSEPSKAMEALRSKHCALLLLCCSTAPEVANLLAIEAHDEFPQLCIIRLRSSNTHQVLHPAAHSVVTIDFNPRNWLSEVDRLLTPMTKAAFL